MCSVSNKNRWFLFEKVRSTNILLQIYKVKKCDFFAKNWNSWSHNLKTFHDEKSGVFISTIIELRVSPSLQQMTRLAFWHCDGTLDIVALSRKALIGHNVVIIKREFGSGHYIACILRSTFKWRHQDIHEKRRWCLMVDDAKTLNVFVQFLA